MMMFTIHGDVWTVSVTLVLPESWALYRDAGGNYLNCTRNPFDDLVE